MKIHENYKVYETITADKKNSEPLSQTLFQKSVGPNFGNSFLEKHIQMRNIRPQYTKSINMNQRDLSLIGGRYLKEQNQFYPKVTEIYQSKESSLDPENKQNDSFKFSNKINGRNTLNVQNKTMGVQLNQNLFLKHKLFKESLVKGGDSIMQNSVFDAEKGKQSQSVSRNEGDTLLRIKAQRVTNNSIQRYMKDIQSIYDSSQKLDLQSKENSLERSIGPNHKIGQKNVERFDQSPQPNYPSFENHESKKKYGQIGWGTDKPDLNYKSKGLYDSIERQHVKFWDQQPQKRFIEMTGSFTQFEDKQLDLNPEIFHLMNHSAQRISIKSLDMQRQNIQRQQRDLQKGYLNKINVSSEDITASRQTFPEVLGIINNPFQKNNLNYAIKNNQAVVTPKIQNQQRFAKNFNQHKLSSKKITKK